MYSDEGDQYEGGFGNQTEEELLDITRIIHRVKTLQCLLIAFRYISRSRSNSHYSLRCFKGKENWKTTFISSKKFCSTVLPNFTSHISHPQSHSPSNLRTVHLTQQCSTIQYNKMQAYLHNLVPVYFSSLIASLFPLTLSCVSRTSPIFILFMYQIFLDSGTLYSGIQHVC